MFTNVIKQQTKKVMCLLEYTLRCNKPPQAEGVNWNRMTEITLRASESGKIDFNINFSMFWINVQILKQIFKQILNKQIFNYKRLYLNCHA